MQEVLVGCTECNEQRGFRDPCAFERQLAMNISQNKPICRSHTGSSFVMDLWSLLHQACVYVGATPASNWVNGTIVFTLPFLSVDPWWCFASLEKLDVSSTKSLSPFHLIKKKITHTCSFTYGPLKWFTMRWWDEGPRKSFLICM